MSEYNHDEEEYKKRMDRWGMHSKDDEDVTIDDCLGDLAAMRKIHGDKIKAVIVVLVYDHLEMNMLAKEIEELPYIEKPPTNCYLCSGGASMIEGLGSLEATKMKMFEQ